MRSSNRHKKMFPHYRVTCAIGLTCPARLNRIEKILYARDRNAPSGKFTTARSMIVRYWESQQKKQWYLNYFI